MRWAARVGQLLLVAVVTWAILRATGIQFGELSATELGRWRPDPGPIVVSTALLVMVYLAHAFLWRRIMQDLGIARPSRRTTVRVYFLSSLGRYVPGKIWQVAGLAYFAGRAGMPPLAATTAAFIGQIGFLTSGLIFVTALLPSWQGPLAAGAAVAVLLLAAAVVFVLTRTGFGLRWRAWVRTRSPRAAGLFDLVDQVRATPAALWIAAYALSWLVLGAAFATFAGAFVDGAGPHARHFAGTVAAAYLSGYLFLLAPAGVGVREGVMTALLAQVVPASAAVVIAVASRLWFTAAELLPLAAIPWLREPVRANNENRGSLEPP